MTCGEMGCAVVAMITAWLPSLDLATVNISPFTATTSGGERSRMEHLKNEKGAEGVDK